MITKRGMMVALLAIICYLAVLVLEIPAFLQLSGILLALLLIGFGWTWLSGYGIEVTLQTDRQCIVGEQATIGITLFSRVPLPRGGFRLRCTFPPGGNSGIYLWSWLHLLMPFRETSVLLRTTCHARGRFEVGPISLFCADPLGLFSLERRYKLAREIEVLPAFTELGGFPFIESGAGFRDPEKTMPSPGFSNDFYAIRSYQYGDSPRWIHWLSTARRQNLMTRQFEAPVQRRVLLVLDCTRTSLVNDTGAFELAVSAAATIVRFAAETDHEVGMLTVGKQSELLKPAAGLDNVQQMISLLCGVKQEGRQGRYNLSRVAESGAQSLIVVSASASRELVESLSALRHEGLSLSVVLTGALADKGGDTRSVLTRVTELELPVCHVTDLEQMRQQLEQPLVQPGFVSATSRHRQYQRI